MTRVHDGTAGLLAGVFGASVTVRRLDGTTVSVRGIFRREPVEVLDESGGSVVVARPSLRVVRSSAADIGRGADVGPGDGRWYRVLRVFPNPSPAADAFVIFELEEVA